MEEFSILLKCTNDNVWVHRCLLCCLQIGRSSLLVFRYLTMLESVGICFRFLRLIDFDPIDTRIWVFALDFLA